MKIRFRNRFQSRNHNTSTPDSSSPPELGSWTRYLPCSDTLPCLSRYSVEQRTVLTPSCSSISHSHDNQPCKSRNMLLKQAWKSANGSCRHGSYRLSASSWLGGWIRSGPHISKPFLRSTFRDLQGWSSWLCDMLAPAPAH